MKFIKIVSGLLLVIVVLLAIGVFVVANNINGLVKTAVEEVGTETLKTTVRLENANIELMKGRMQLSGLSVANPAGFSPGNVLVMKDIVLQLDLAAMANQLVDVVEVGVDGLQVVAEQKGTNTNLQALLNNVNSGSQPAAKQPEPAAESGAPDVLIKIRQLNFTNGSTHLVSDRWGEQDLPLPAIKLSNVGGSAGVPADQLAEKIVKPLLKQLIAGLEQSVKALVEGKAKEKLKAKEDELKQKLDSKLEEKLGGDREALKSLLSR